MTDGRRRLRMSEQDYSKDIRERLQGQMYSTKQSTYFWHKWNLINMGFMSAYHPQSFLKFNDRGVFTLHKSLLIE